MVRLRILGSRLDIFENSSTLESIRQNLIRKCKHFRDNYFQFGSKTYCISFKFRNIPPNSFQNKYQRQIKNHVFKWDKTVSQKLDFQIFVRELKHPKISSYYLASLIVEELEKRAPFRRALRFRIEQVKNVQKIQGIRIQVSGRLIGAEIARTEWTRKGQVPLHTISANLDYSSKAASTIYGLLGVKVWIFIV
uniref:30S ribosomal protein S3, chloroplastic n=1 Tax=Lepidodinium chlorophorum TaxID=107758 RepID=A0A0F7R549_LEPCH|nr:ribosomal protein S3 [Lepidodinium chlorophorum]BAR72299.1 ribosomal protein S3 [Lepidodinium chlorophorum]